jgi:hypothetical protein
VAAIVYQTDKRSSIIYAYQSVSYCVKEKKNHVPGAPQLVGWIEKLEKLSLLMEETERNKMQRYPPTSL